MTAPDEVIDLRAELEREMEAFIAHDPMQSTIDYLRQGRPFRRLDTPALETIWAGLYEVLARDFHAEPLRYIGQLEAEMSLRGLKPPMERVNAARRLFKQKLAARIAELQADPAAWAEMNAWFPPAPKIESSVTVVSGSGGTSDQTNSAFWFGMTAPPESTVNTEKSRCE